MCTVFSRPKKKKTSIFGKLEMLSLKPPGSSEHSRASSPVPPGTHSGGVSPTVAGGPSTSTDPPLLGMVANALKMHHPDEPLSLSVGLDKKGQPKKKVCF